MSAGAAWHSNCRRPAEPEGPAGLSCLGPGPDTDLLRPPNYPANPQVPGPGHTGMPDPCLGRAIHLAVFRAGLKAHLWAVCEDNHSRSHVGRWAAARHGFGLLCGHDLRDSCGPLTPMPSPQGRSMPAHRIPRPLTSHSWKAPGEATRTLVGKPASESEHLLL